MFTIGLLTSYSVMIWSVRCGTFAYLDLALPEEKTKIFRGENHFLACQGFCVDCLVREEAPRLGVFIDQWPYAEMGKAAESCCFFFPFL
jgi:hypothetical protein